jgi:ketosteroid isomerase-like protein
MYSWLVSRLVRRGFDRLSAGDPSVILAAFGDGARFVFPGASSWAIDTTDRAEIEAWFGRFAALGPAFTVHDIVVKGPPWNTRVRTRGSDRIQAAGPAYTNEWVQCARLAWGKLREDVIYLDTERWAAVQAALQPAVG